MDVGSRLALRAIVLGLRRAGQLGPHTAAVLNDELRLAARQAREWLFDREADAIELLAVEIRIDERAEVASIAAAAPRRTLATGMPDFKS